MSTIDVGAGQTFSGTVNAGDTVEVETGGETVGATIFGTEILDTGALSSNDTIGAGGTIWPDDGTISNVTIAGGELWGLDPSTTFTGGVTFVGPGGNLALNGFFDNSFPGPVAGFGEGDEITFPGASLFGPSLTVTGDSVALTTDGTVVNIDVVGASSDQLVVEDVGNGSGVQLEDVLTIECVCFLAGTVIATPTGGCAIETLKAGDFVLTADGAAMPVRWLGQQTVATRFADKLRVAPIRIREGALGRGLPVRDLHVSPDHALMVDDVFVQAGALVNGVSILREDADIPERLVYFHVELSDHSLILAEGVAAETFIDNVDRLAFDNWIEHAALGDRTVPMFEMPHARAKSHRQVPQALRARLIARGVELYGSGVAAVA